MKTLYITDLDGTFLNNKAEITEKSFEYISKAINNGACFTLATARTFATVIDMFKDVKLSLPIVLMNGVMVYDPVAGKTVSSHPVNSASAQKILETFKKHSLSPLVYYDRGNYLEIKYCDSPNQYQMSYVNKRNHSSGKLFTNSPSLSISDEDKIIYFVTLDLYENIYELYNEVRNVSGVNVAFYRDNYTDCYFLEIFAEGVSKASGLNEVRRIIGAEKVVAFGDNLNDIEMFYEADEAYAVANACAELKKAATAVIGSNEESSVAEYIYKHFTGEING